MASPRVGLAGSFPTLPYSMRLTFSEGGSFFKCRPTTLPPLQSSRLAWFRFFRRISLFTFFVMRFRPLAPFFPPMHPNQLFSLRTFVGGIFLPPLPHLILSAGDGTSLERPLRSQKPPPSPPFSSDCFPPFLSRAGRSSFLGDVDPLVFSSDWSRTLSLNTIRKSHPPASLIPL